MLTGIIIAVLLVVVLGMFVSSRKKIFADDEFNVKPVLSIAATLIVGLIIAFVQPYQVERVDASGVGFKINLAGNERGVSNYEYRSGWVVVNTWTEQFVETPTNQQHIEYDTIKVITKGGFMADISPSFNYSVLPSAAADMFVSLRKPLKEIEQGWLKNAIFSSVNDVANKWTVDSIFNSREAFESAIVLECNKRVSQWFKVTQLRSNIIPPPALQAAIIAKTKAIQEVQVAENNKKVAVAQAETAIAQAEGAARAKIAAAKGDSAQAVINAAGDAAAIRLKQNTITPLYIEYIRASTWNGAYPTTMLGSGSGTIFNLK